MVYDVTQCYTMLYNVIQCYAMLCNVIQCYTMVYNVTQCYTALCKQLQCGETLGLAKRQPDVVKEDIQWYEVKKRYVKIGGW